jgi:Na+/melibiose symporter-like transporter
MMRGIPNSGGEGFHGIDYLKITIFGLALSALWGSLHSIVLPLRLLEFVSSSEKNTCLGILTLCGLLLAMAVQPIAGAISDRSSFRWGRRRLYILLGTTAAFFFIPGIGFAGSYAAIFLIYCLIQISTNTAQGPYQAFIPDLVPEGKRGLASGVKSLLEITGGFALVYLIVYTGKYFTSQEVSWLWLVLGILAAMLLITALLTVVTVKESLPASAPESRPLPNLHQSFRIDMQKNSAFIIFLVSRLLFIMALTTLQSFAFYYIQDNFAFVDTTTATATLLAAAGISMLIVVYPAGYLSDRIGRKPILVSAGLIGATGISVIFFAPAYEYVIIGGALQGIAGGAFMSPNWALATDLVPKSEEARYLGLANLATAGGAALARLIGPVIDFVNSYSYGQGYQVMLLACFTYFVIGSALVLKIKVRN